MFTGLAMIFMYVIFVLFFMLSNGGKNIGSPAFLVVLLPAIVFYAYLAWRHFTSRHERREERRIERKIKQARRAIAARGGYADQMFIASKGGNISVANLIIETDEAWTLKVEKREVRISKSDSQQRAFSARSEALKWAGAEQGKIEHFVALDSAKAAPVNQIQS